MRATAGRRILVVDDEPSMRALVRDVLHLDGYIVDEAANGVDALGKMRGAPPSAVVLDLMMPVMGGRRVAESMHQEQALTGIPFILLSADPGLQEACHDLAAAACLHKPFEIDALLAAVHDALA
jgi:CheY-like chemotaxis protein